MEALYIFCQYAVISLFFALIVFALFMISTPIGKRMAIRFIDWYIRAYYSHDYIHRDMIREEITKRVDDAVRKTNNFRDDQEINKLNALRDVYHIQEDGYVAEIMRLEKRDIEVQRMRKKVEELYFKIVKRAKELVVITTENWHEGEKIVTDVSASISRLDIIKTTTTDLVKEIEDSRKEDYRALGICENEMQ